MTKQERRAKVKAIKAEMEALLIKMNSLPIDTPEERKIVHTLRDEYLELAKKRMSL